MMDRSGARDKSNFPLFPRTVIAFVIPRTPFRWRPDHDHLTSTAHQYTIIVLRFVHTLARRMTQVKRSLGRPAATRKMQRFSLLTTVVGLLVIVGLIATLFKNDPFPGVRRAAMRQRRQAETQRDFRDPPADTIKEDEPAPEGDGGRLFTFELESLNEGIKGKIEIRTHPSWAPLGVAHFHELMDSNFYDMAKFFRVVPDFVVQFGIAADPKNRRPKPILDDPVVQTNARGTLTFATSGADTRSTQLFINIRKNGNAFLDKMGFAPIGEVIV